MAIKMTAQLGALLTKKLENKFKTTEIANKITTTKASVLPLLAIGSSFSFSANSAIPNKVYARARTVAISTSGPITPMAIAKPLFAGRSLKTARTIERTRPPKEIKKAYLICNESLPPWNKPTSCKINTTIRANVETTVIEPAATKTPSFLIPTTAKTAATKVKIPAAIAINSAINNFFTPLCALGNCSFLKTIIVYIFKLLYTNKI